MSNFCSLERAPAYRLHPATGQAIVAINGRDIYLGKHGTAASSEAYRRKINEWAQGGGRLIASKHSSSVAELVVAYTKFATDYYRKDGKATDEVRMIKTAIRIARQLYGRAPAIEFGPLALKACREKKIERDWCRSHINKQVGRVMRMFKWATENEMIPGSNYEALRCVAGLKKGRSDAREGRKVKPISDVDIQPRYCCERGRLCHMAQKQRVADRLHHLAFELWANRRQRKRLNKSFVVPLGSAGAGNEGR